MTPTTRSSRYAAAHERVIALLDVVPDEQRVPATPAWDARELLAHLTGVADDLVAGRVDDWAEPEWTAAQVSSRAGRTRGSLIDEWARLVTRVGEVIDDPAAAGLPEHFGRMPLMDLVCHECDLREAVGAPLPLDEEDWTVLAQHRRWVLGLELEEAGIEGIDVRTEEGDHWGGSGPVVASVRLPRYELWRSLTGRRTRKQVRAYAWTGDLERVLPVWAASTFGWPED